MRLALFTVITSRRDLWRSNSHRVWLILWLLGVVASYTPYGFIHLLLLIAAHGALRFFDFAATIETSDRRTAQRFAQPHRNVRSPPIGLGANHNCQAMSD